MSTRKEQMVLPFTLMKSFAAGVKDLDIVNLNFVELLSSMSIKTSLHPNLVL